MSKQIRSVRYLACVLVLALVLGGTALAEEQKKSCHEGAATQQVANGDGPSYTRTLEPYEVPHLTLLDQSGQSIDLDELLEGPRPVALNFIFTTCTTICPVMAATFSKLQRELGDDVGDLRLVSISIDPEYDRPEVLASYAQRFHAEDRWRFLTGTQEQITSVLQSFNALTGSKVNHRPLTFFKLPDEEEWVRIEGLPAASTLADEYRHLAMR
jgi:protein SCO1/2